MKFLIEVSGRDQPDLIHSLDEARKTLIAGGCFLNVCGCTNVVMKPATDADEAEWRRQYRDSHPKPAARWIK
jgi:hypothetical protein